ncbi:MAG: hypothetical protein ACE5F1_10800, partial [Planctomycetota bacterium]
MTRRFAVWMLLAAAACSGMKRHARELAGVVELHSQELATLQSDSLSTFESFVNKAQDQVELLTNQNVHHVHRLKELAVEAMETRIAAVEARLLTRFDQRAWTAITEEFEENLERRFLNLVEVELEQHGAKERELEKIAEQSPEDVPARRRYEAQRVKSKLLSNEALVNEADLRRQMGLEIVTTRNEFKKKLDARMTQLRLQLEIRRVKRPDRGKIGEIIDPQALEMSRENAEAFDRVRSEIRSFQEEIMAKHSLHQTYNERISDYILKELDVGPLLKVRQDKLRMDIGELPSEVPYVKPRFTESIVSIEAPVLEQGADGVRLLTV